MHFCTKIAFLAFFYMHFFSLLLQPAHLGLQWKYEVQWYDEGDRSLENVIVVESKPRNVGSIGLINLDMWTSSGATSDMIPTGQDPLKLFVQVSKGSSPVFMAKVKVMVSVTFNNGSSMDLTDIDLFDSGNGNPDLTAGDGIYSRYLTQYPEKGRYSFSAFVDDNEEKAYTIQVGRNGRAMPARPQDPAMNPVCCGSEITVPADLRYPTGSFKRTLNGGPVIHLIEVPDAEIDQMPPARISDLRLAPDKTGRKLVAMWTAPGNDYDHGNVTQYNFVFSEDVMDLLDANRQPPILHEVSRSDPAGLKALYSFQFSNFDKDYHVALYGIDGNGNKANISNIVLVRLPQPASTVGPTGPTTQPPGPQDTDWVMVGAVTGVVLTLIFLLLVGLFLYIYLGKRRRSNSVHKSKSSGVNVDLPPAGTGSDNSSFDDTKNSSSNHLVPQISTISNAYKSLAANGGPNGGPTLTNGVSNGAPTGSSVDGRTSSTSFANGITPTYWSASQLLKEHEERKIRENSAGVPPNISGGPMGPIAEENAAYDYQSEAYHPQNYYYDYQQSHELYQQPQMMYPPYGGQRLSTADSAYNYQSGAVDYHPNADQHAYDIHATDSELLRNNNKVMSAIVPKNSGTSDNSSSGTLGLANNSLQGSLISVNSGHRPPSSVAKTRNITQV